MNYDKTYIIESAQLKQLLESNPKMLVVSSLIALLVAYIERPLFSPQLTALLLTIALVVNLIRAIIGYYFLKHPTSELKAVRKRIHVFRTGVLIASLVLGFNSYLVFETKSLEHQHFILFILTGMSAGAIIGYSIDRVSALIYQFFSLTPVLFILTTSDNNTHIAMGVAGLIYSIFASMSVFSFNKQLTEGVLFKYEADNREQEIKQIAFYDVLTSLPNRRLLQDRLQHAMLVSKRYGKTGAVLFIDLDKFKLLNDTHGHEKGDLLLKQVAQRLKNTVRQSDTVSRYGGDEFIVMLENLNEDMNTAKEQTIRIANNIIERLKTPYQLDDIEYHSSPSIGIAMFDEHGDTDDALLRNADTAMYQAKKSGGNVLKMFAANTKSTKK
jgi:diguanylate cyclase (GGDEF)-like protein